MKHLLLIGIINLLLSMPAAAQTTVRGHIVNERGEAVEYVTVTMTLSGDSIVRAVIGDKDGHFDINVPNDDDASLTFSHVSYESKTLSREQYAEGYITVMLKERAVTLDEVPFIHKKAKTIAHKGLPAPGTAAMSGDLDKAEEMGPIVSIGGKSMSVSHFIVPVKSCSYESCTLSINVYEMDGKECRNILTRPIYQQLTRTDESQRLVIEPGQPLVLERHKRYFIGISIVDISDTKGRIVFPGSFHKSYAGRIAIRSGMTVPMGPSVTVKGYEVE